MTQGGTQRREEAPSGAPPQAAPAEPLPGRLCSPPPPAPGQAPAVRVEMLSDPVYLSGARELVASISKRFGFDELGCSKIALAVDEALCNVIRHGYRRAADRPIWVSIWPLYEPGCPHAGSANVCGIQVVIEDEARQVDPAAIRGRELDDVRPGGLGVHIIREVMDHVVYERREGEGMRLTLRKHLTHPEGRTPEPTAASTAG